MIESKVKSCIVMSPKTFSRIDKKYKFIHKSPGGQRTHLKKIADVYSLDWLGYVIARGNYKGYYDLEKFKDKK